MNYNLWNLFGPLSWPAWFWLAAIIATWRGKARGAKRLWVLAGLWFALIAGTPLGHVIIRPLEQRYALPKNLTQVDGIVVLTGSERLQLSTTYHQPVLNDAGERLIVSAMLAHQFPAARLAVVGGVREKNSVRDIDVARQIFIGTGIAPSRLVMVDKTTDTCTNAISAAPLIKSGQTWLLVTSAAHMPRAMSCFLANGVRPLPYPVDFRGRENLWSPIFTPGTLTNLSAFDLASHEWVGLIWYRLTGRTQSLFPQSQAISTAAQ